jgi:hypothetical protein
MTSLKGTTTLKAGRDGGYTMLPKITSWPRGSNMSERIRTSGRKAIAIRQASNCVHQDVADPPAPATHESNARSV